MHGIDFEETFAPVERLEEIIMFLAFSCYKNLKVYQMDVKFVFLNGKIEDEFYIEKPEGFLLSESRGYVYKIKKGTLWSQASPKRMVFKAR